MVLSFALAPGVVFGTAVAVVLAWVVYEVLFSPLRQFPGPFLAKFTDLYRARLVLAGRFEHWNRAWHDQWGSAAVRVGPNTISISDPDLIKVIYATKNAWLKTDMYRPNDLAVNGQRIPNIFNTRDLAFHAKYKTPIAGFWSQTQVLELEPLMDETLLLLVDTLGKRFADTPGAVCPMDDWLAYYAWDAVANVSFGRHYGFVEQGADVGGMIAESTAGLFYFAPVSQVPWVDEWLDKNPVMRFGPRPLLNGFLYTVKIISEYQQKLLGAAGVGGGNGGDAAERKKENKKPIEHFLDKYHRLKNNNSSGGGDGGGLDFVDDTQVTRWLMINVLAGGDSTAGAMRSVMYHLGRDPRVRARLVAELDGAGVTVPALYRDIRQLPYLDAVIWESLRVCPGVGLLLEREVPPAAGGGLRLPDGRVVPAGTKAGINPGVVTRDRALFGEDGAEFRPERWLRGDGEAEPDFARRHRRMLEATDFTFGAGDRVCLGKYLARTEMYKLVATLYRAFEIRPVRADQEWKCRNSWFMYQSDMPMVVERRGEV